MFNPGDKVTYIKTHCPFEHGIVKSISDKDHTFVVYHCNDDWDHYYDYTAARTCNSDLIMGWV